MGRGYLSEEERKILLKNPYIRDVNGKRVSYSDEFKLHFIEEYKAGKWPQQIFREAGLDVSILGAKRIERAAARWRASYEDGSLCEYKATVPLKIKEKTAREKSLQEQVNEQEQEIALLKKQIRILCEACNLKELA